MVLYKHWGVKLEGLGGEAGKFGGGSWEVWGEASPPPPPLDRTLGIGYESSCSYPLEVLMLELNKQQYYIDKKYYIYYLDNLMGYSQKYSQKLSYTTLSCIHMSHVQTRFNSNRTFFSLFFFLVSPFHLSFFFPFFLFFFYLPSFFFSPFSP